MKHLHSYSRWSDPIQGDGDSEHRQSHRRAGWAREHGYAERSAFIDPGVSAFRGRNARKGDLARLLKAVEKRIIRQGDAVWFENLDRLSRLPAYESIKLFQAIIDAGVNIVVDELGDDDEPLLLSRDRLNRDDHLFDRVHSELRRAHRESKRKSGMSTKVMATKRSDARAGVAPFMGRRCSSWLKLRFQVDENGNPILDRKNRLIPVRGKDGYFYEAIPEKVSIVVRIFEMASKGMGVNSIAGILNAEKVPILDDRVWKDRRGDWHGSYILQLLRNDAVLGIYQPHRWIDEKRVLEGDPIPVYYPQIIDKALVLRARRSLDQNRTNGKGRKGATFANLFTTMCECAECAGGLQYGDPGKGQGQPKLFCYTNKMKHRRKQDGAPLICSSHARFPYRALEKTVLSVFGLGIENMIADLIPAQRENRWIAELEEVIEKKQRSLDDLVDRLLNHSSDSVRRAAQRQIDLLGPALDKDRVELERARQGTITAAFTEVYDAGFVDRLRAGMAKITSDNIEERFAARQNLNTELKQRIQSIILSSDNVVTVTIAVRSRGALAFSVAPDGRVGDLVAIVDDRRIPFEHIETFRLSKMQVA